MDQRLEECIALTRFRERSGLLPGFLERVVRDPPDFLITDGIHRIAVEMTRYLQRAGPRGSKLAQQEAMEMRVVARARELFEAAHPGVYVHVSPFFKIDEIKPDDVESYAAALAELVFDVLPADPSADDRLTTSRAEWPAVDRVGLGNVLATLQGIRWWRMDTYDWGALSGMASADTADLESSIRRKEPDLARYSVSADESWLIIYAWALRAAFFDMDVLSPQMFTSKFDRVVFFDATVASFILVA
jgi:hypothetical protein